MPATTKDIESARLMLKHIEAGTTYQAADHYRIPVRNYLDPARWRREVESIFMRKPIVVAFTAEIREPLAYKAMDIMGVPILVTRGNDGVARVFLNVCRHRGAVVASGCGRARSFSCPYHGWTYDPLGRLVAIRKEAHFGSVERERLGLTELASEERDGIIYAILRPGVSMDLDEWLGNYSDVIRDLNLKDCHFYGDATFNGPNWKLAMDGYLEIYHFDVLHRQTFSTFITSDVAHVDAYGHHMATTFCARTIDTLRSLPESEWRPKAHVNTTLDLFPNTIIGFLFEGAGKTVGYDGGIVQIERVFPGPTPDKSLTVQTILSTEPLQSQAHREFADQNQQMARRGVETEDYKIGFDIQSAASSGANEEFVIGRNEGAIQHFHRTVDALLNAAD